jgi:hypothetical protein
VEQGEIFSLSVEISGTRKRPTINFPQMSGFQVLNSNPSTSSSMSIINGKTSITQTYTYSLRANSAGNFQIPSFEIILSGKRIKSAPISMKVVKQITSEGAAEVFLKNEISSANVYINQEVTVSTKLYIKDGVRIYNNNLSFEKEPLFSGFWREKYEIKNFEKLSSELVKDARYSVYLIRKDALFPTKKGKLKVESVRINLGIVKKSKRRRRSPFGSIFDDDFFGGGGNVVQKSLTAQSRTINVKDFPINDSETFSRFSGILKLTHSIDKTNVKTNDAIKFSLNFEGQGNFNILESPEFFISPDLESYEPSTNQKIFKNRKKISAVKKFEYVFVPRVAGKQQIGPIKLEYLDIRTKKIRSLEIPAITISVKQGKSHMTVASSGNSTLGRDVKQLDKDIRFIRLESGNLEKAGSYLYKNIYYYFAYLFVFLMFVGLYYSFLNREKLMGNANFKRKKEASGKVLKWLKNANIFKSEKNSERFFPAIQESIQGYIADKLGLNSAGFTTESFEESLRTNKIDDELIKEAQSILESCDFYRFSNPTDPEKEMDEIYSRTETLIKKLTKQI